MVEIMSTEKRVDVVILGAGTGGITAMNHVRRARKFIYIVRVW